MSQVTQDTAWLADSANSAAHLFHPAVRQLVARFYELADSPSPHAGPRLAKDIFTPDGTWYAPGGKPPIEGSEAIARSRDHAWDTVESRRHAIQKVFGSADGSRRELVLLGTLEQVMKSGQSMNVGFAAHVKIVAADTEDPRIQSMRVYAA